MTEDINLIPAIDKGFREDIPSVSNIIGNEISMGMRKNVILKRRGLSMSFQNRTLAGKIYHHALEKRKVRNNITKIINKALGYTEVRRWLRRYILLENGNYIRFKVKKEKEMFIELPRDLLSEFPEDPSEEDPTKYYFRMHQDIFATLYTIEIKTTNMPKSMWGDIAAYNLMQLNTYLGFNHQEFGYLLKIDLGSTKEDERYKSHGGFLNSASKKYKYIWNKYFLLHKHNFDQKLFDYAIQRLKEYFRCIIEEVKEDDIPCPQFIFSCEDQCSEFCSNPIKKVDMNDNDTCTHCGEVIEMGMKGIIRNNKIYHYTDGHRNRFEPCIQSAKEAWEVEQDE